MKLFILIFLLPLGIIAQNVEDPHLELNKDHKTIVVKEGKRIRVWVTSDTSYVGTLRIIDSEKIAVDSTVILKDEITLLRAATTPTIVRGSSSAALGGLLLGFGITVASQTQVTLYEIGYPIAIIGSFGILSGAYHIFLGRKFKMEKGWELKLKQ